MSEELVAFLRRYTDLVLVSFWEDDVPLVQKHLLAALERFQRIPVLHLRLAEYRDWAYAHGVHGTPALVAYYRQQPLFRLIGRTTPEELLQRLLSCGL